MAERATLPDVDEPDNSPGGPTDVLSIWRLRLLTAASKHNQQPLLAEKR